MSERVYIIKDRKEIPEDAVYDCIYDEKTTLKELMYEWTGYSPGDFVCFGPWRIYILDLSVFPKFKKDFLKIGKYIKILQSFEDVWAITYIKKNGEQIIVEHPTEEEMVEFEKKIKKEDDNERKNQKN